jgi:putative spermidine/putrescine transport system ATP-binding protein
LGDETFAVRVDRLMLKRPDEAVTGPSIAGSVSEIEYQGTYVRVAIAIKGATDVSAQLTENQFDAANYRVGERVLATWEKAQASPLTRSSVTVPSPERVARHFGDYHDQSLEIQ